MSLHILDPGLLSLLVDTGRANARHLGMPLSGAADRAAFMLGNGLVGNSPGSVAVEVTLVGPTIQAQHPTVCVIFGAAFRPTRNGHEVRPGSTFTLHPGDVLRVGGTVSGCRGYLCASGGFDAPEILGSRSSPEPLRPGDTLKCPPSRGEARSLPFDSFDDLEAKADADRVPTLRVLDGPQRDWFTDDTFYTQVFEVSPASNRMGIRLKGQPLARRAGELVSEAAAPGAVQVTNDGLPVVLGVDGQTIGGYPKIAHVVRADLDRLAQLRPGEQIRFQRVTPAEAEHAAKERAARLTTWLTRLRIAERAPVVG